MQRTLMRIESSCVQEAEKLVRGIHIHLAHADLLSVLMQIGSTQRAYVATAGCEGCAQGRCMPGCYTNLLCRLLIHCLAACTIQPVPLGLARRSYTRLVLAWPTRQAQQLTGEIIQEWPEARLILHWSNGPRVAAMLSVGQDGPDPGAMLRGIGWSVWTMPTAATKPFCGPFPSAIPLRKRFAGDPMLLLPLLYDTKIAIDTANELAVNQIFQEQAAS